MIITKRQLAKIIQDSLGHINESLLLSLLVGCKSECNLYSVAPELKNLTIPECVTEEIYPFETLDWESGVKPSELQRIALDEGYTVDMRGPIATSTDGEGHVQMEIKIPNVPQRLVRYLSEMGILESASQNSALRNLEDDELCNLSLYFVRFLTESGKEIVCKNRFHLRFFVGGQNEDSQEANWNDFYVGMADINAADAQCNEEFRTVVANVNPKLTPDEDTGFEDTGI